VRISLHLRSFYHAALTYHKNKCIRIVSGGNIILLWLSVWCIYMYHSALTQHQGNIILLWLSISCMSFRIDSASREHNSSLAQPKVYIIPRWLSIRCTVCHSVLTQHQENVMLRWLGVSAVPFRVDSFSRVIFRYAKHSWMKVWKSKESPLKMRLPLGLLPKNSAPRTSSQHRIAIPVPWVNTELRSTYTESTQNDDQ
jgi:hypothetical protein